MLIPLIPLQLFLFYESKTDHELELQENAVWEAKTIFFF